MVDTFRKVAMDLSTQRDYDEIHTVLVEGVSKRSTDEREQWTGRNDGFKRCVFSPQLPDGSMIQPGDYVQVKCIEPGVSTLQSTLIGRC